MAFRKGCRHSERPADLRGDVRPLFFIELLRQLILSLNYVWHYTGSDSDVQEAQNEKKPVECRLFEGLDVSLVDKGSCSIS